MNESQILRDSALIVQRQIDEELQEEFEKYEQEIEMKLKKQEEAIKKKKKTLNKWDPENETDYGEIA